MRAEGSEKNKIGSGNSRVFLGLREDYESRAEPGMT